MWAIILASVGVAIAIFILFGLGTIIDFRDASKTKRHFIDLINRGSNEFDALVEISRQRHPELSIETHKRIAVKIGDVDKFIGFMQNAAEGVFWKKGRKLHDMEVWALLQSGTFIYKGNGVYTVRVDRQLYERLINQNKEY